MQLNSSTTCPLGAAAKTILVEVQKIQLRLSVSKLGCREYALRRFCDSRRRRCFGCSLKFDLLLSSVAIELCLPPCITTHDASMLSMAKAEPASPSDGQYAASNRVGSSATRANNYPLSCSCTLPCPPLPRSSRLGI